MSAAREPCDLGTVTYVVWTDSRGETVAKADFTVPTGPALRPEPWQLRGTGASEIEARAHLGHLLRREGFTGRLRRAG